MTKTDTVTCVACLPPFYMTFHSRPHKPRRRHGQLSYIIVHPEAPLLQASNNPYGLPAETPRLLSNSAFLPMEWRGHIYPSVDHAYQGAKYLFASNRPELHALFVKGGSLEMRPTQVSRAGSDVGMTERQTKLDLDRWDQLAEPIMTELIEYKCRHPLIHAILKICHTYNIRLYFVSTTDMYWGCDITVQGVLRRGENMFGRLYMDVYKKTIGAT